MPHVVIIARVTVKEGSAGEYVAAFAPLLQQAERPASQAKCTPHLLPARLPARVENLSRADYLGLTWCLRRPRRMLHVTLFGDQAITGDGSVGSGCARRGRLPWSPFWP